MLQINIPGRKPKTIEYLLTDFNGTLAVDGCIIPEIKDLLIELSEKISIHVITADTFGKVKENMQFLNCAIEIVKGTDQTKQKLMYLKKIGNKKTISIGNGRNDKLMLKNAALGILVINEEGAAGACFESADVICKSTKDALELLLKPLRLTATLRK